jgi:hypothetical protein
VSPDPDNALVQAWDRAQDSPRWQRPAALAAALGAAPVDDAPVGVVARHALEAAAAWFGPDVDGVFSCRACGEHLEASVAVADLLAGAPAEDPGPFAVDVDGETLFVRLPRPSDVAAAAAADSSEDAVRVLLERIALEAPLGLDLAASADAVGAACEARDPLGVVSVELVCPACGTADTPALDVAQWCWAMADGHARRLLDEVHVLASAYGWSEREILALGPRRRAFYLERVA